MVAGACAKCLACDAPSSASVMPLQLQTCLAWFCLKLPEVFCTVEAMTAGAAYITAAVSSSVGLLA